MSIRVEVTSLAHLPTMFSPLSGGSGRRDGGDGRIATGRAMLWFEAVGSGGRFEAWEAGVVESLGSIGFGSG